MHFDLDALWKKTQAMLDGFLALLPNLIIGGLVFAAFVLAGRAAYRGGIRLAKRLRRHGNLGLILGNLFRWVLILIGLLIALSVIIPSFEARNLIELLGIGTVAVGFAFRDILQNFFAGILILVTEPFEIGDDIRVRDFEGTVQTIETRATTIRSFDGKRVVIPNTTLFTEAVVVTAPASKLRTSVDLTLTRSDDLEAVRNAVVAAVREIDGVLADPAPDIIIDTLGDSSVKVRLRWWSDRGGQRSCLVQSRVLQAVQRALAASRADAPGADKPGAVGQPVLESSRAARGDQPGAA
ncbi:MAG: mechanosensitive ion channel [Myxococcales bacterium]|nr:mechanosensitive ion channel [Myxococcales bacterium]